MKECRNVKIHGDRFGLLLYHDLHAPVKAESEKNRLKEARSKIRAKKRKKK